MSYIARDDGVHFVIPSYREVLVAKSVNAIQKDVMTLSQNYGEYMTLQRKGPQQYEVAFSPDTGYLLGETVWSHFNKPDDLIYCEAIPNTTEAILVIVKNGSVYLDGSFPVESIPEELVIFLTQQNHFEIYVYGDVPISEKPAEGKFSFESASVKSFKVLDEPAFKNLPLIRAYQFQLVAATLKAHGVGALPIKQIVIGLGVIGLVAILYSYFTTSAPPPQEAQMEPNPYQTMVDSLASPAPSDLMAAFLDKMDVFFKIPGWTVNNFKLQGSTITATVQSPGGSIESLIYWCKEHDATTIITNNGIIVAADLTVKSRSKPKKVFPSKEVLAILVDNLAKVYPGNHLSLTITKGAGPFNTVTINIDVKDISPMLLGMMGEQFKDLPLTLDSIDITEKDEMFTGTITLTGYGSA